MNALVVIEDFIVEAKTHKVLIIIMDTTQVTQATSLLEAKPKTIFDIGCDHLAPNMAIVLFVHALHL
jgi:hypothetical protein